MHLGACTVCVIYSLRKGSGNPPRLFILASFLQISSFPPPLFLLFFFSILIPEPFSYLLYHSFSPVFTLPSLFLHSRHSCRRVGALIYLCLCRSLCLRLWFVCDAPILIFHLCLQIYLFFLPLDFIRDPHKYTTYISLAR